MVAENIYFEFLFNVAWRTEVSGRIRFNQTATNVHIIELVLINKQGVIYGTTRHTNEAESE